MRTVHKKWRCTKLKAFWCPLHGYCICKERFGRPDMKNTDCPLHKVYARMGKIGSRLPAPTDHPYVERMVK